ncbi:MAG: hypothetical protein FHK79_21925 [Pseudomonas sp.]|nr:MAG: hypothetical protein FHK79_21925 [Pseudomonas sp.]
MNIQNGARALTGSACSEKVTKLFFVVHPKVAKPLFGPFLTFADAEHGRLAICSPGAIVEARQVESVDDLTRIRAEAHGETLRAFMARQGVAHE